MTTNKQSSFWRWTKRLLLGLLLLLALVLATGAIYESVSTARELRAHPAPGELVDVGGHRLHINCQGTGSPVVILEAGSPDWSAGWSLVQPEVAKFTRVCSYDRAGYGWSDPGPTPRTSQQIAEELHSLLERASVSGPYVLVAHSFGGLPVRIYADRYPNEVAGMVLVETSHEDTLTRFPPVFAESLENGIRQLGWLRLGAYFGTARLMGMRAQTLNTLYQEMASVSESFEQVRATGSLGDLPLAVVVAGRVQTQGLPPGTTPEEVYPILLELQKELASLSTNSTYIIADDSAHEVQIDQPDVIINAIREVVGKARE